MLKLGLLTINQIREIFEGEGPDESFIQQCKEDGRQGVKRLVISYLNQLEKAIREKERIEKLFVYEQELWQQGYTNVAGIDEVGRGPLAGPVVAAAVILPQRLTIVGLNDSKQVPEKRRPEIAREIRKHSAAWSIGLASVKEIDEFNILGATKLAMARAIEGLGIQAEFLLIDAVELSNVKISQKAIISGDTLSASIAAASILAKVYRDELMNTIHQDYPYYNFSANKGYMTAEHARALELYGPCAVHRTSFEPVRTARERKSPV